MQGGQAVGHRVVQSMVSGFATSPGFGSQSNGFHAIEESKNVSCASTRVSFKFAQTFDALLWQADRFVHQQHARQQYERSKRQASRRLA